MAVYQSLAASAETHRRRVERGVAEVRVYLQARFPDSVIEVVKSSSHAPLHACCTFRILRGNQHHLLQVTDAVLDLDTDGVASHLRRLQVARTLREEGAGRAVVVTTNDIRLEPI